MPFSVIRATLKGMESPSSAVTLQSGQSQVLPSGQYLVQLGKYSAIQYWDPVSLTWRNLINSQPGRAELFSSDGYNYRLINLSGTVVGGVPTTLGTSNAAKNGVWPAGSSSTPGVTAIVAAPANAPTVTAQMNVIVGGAVSQTVTVTKGGSGYLMPPILVFDPPPPGGLRATGYAVLTTGAVSSVVITNQGAGYTSAPAVNVFNSWNDPGVGAVITAALVPSTGTTIGYGQTVAVTMANYGGGYATVPTITCAGMTSTAVTARFHPSPSAPKRYRYTPIMEATPRLRLATLDDAPAIDDLMKASIRETTAMRSISKSSILSSISSMLRRNWSRSDGISDMVSIAAGDGE
jgi:hypothetical protein